MTVKYENSNNVDFDTLFEPRIGGDPKHADVGIQDSSNVDLSERYYPLSDGGTAIGSNTGFQDSAGTDLKDIYAAIGTVVRNLELHITTNEQEVNLRTWANTETGQSLDSYYLGFQKVVIYVDSGVWVWSNSTGTPAMTTGVFPVTLKIINNGYIAGAGGNGGGGGNTLSSPGYDGDNGSVGGDAISLGMDVEIDNDNGYIYGGGGGGGGGGAASCITNPPPPE